MLNILLMVRRNINMTKRCLIKLLQEKENKLYSKWSKGVMQYCFDLLDAFKEDEDLGDSCYELQNKLLNGCYNWSDFSWSGNALVYDVEICERLASPSFQKKKDYGRLQPDSHTLWIDVQTKALIQAYKIIETLAIK